MITNRTRIKRRCYLKATGGVTLGGLSALSGCLGSESESGAITVGAAVPLTGSLSALGAELEQGYELGVERINEQENLDADVELVLEDDESDPKTNRQKLQRLLDRNELEMIWGSVTTPLIYASTSIAEQSEIPILVIGWAYERGHEEKEFEWVFSPYPFSRDVADATHRVLDLVDEDHHPERIAIWETDSGWGQEIGTYWEETLTEDGYEIVLREQTAIGARDFSTLITKSKAQDPDVLLGNPVPEDAIVQIKQMRSQGFAPKLVEFVRGAHTSGWWNALGETGAYVLGSPGWVPGLTTEGNEEFQRRYRGAHGVSDVAKIPPLVGAAYNVTQVAEQALAAAEANERAAIRETLRSESFETVMGEFGFNEIGVPDDLVAPAGQWWDGGFHLVSPKTDSEVTMDLKYPLEPWNDR